MHLLKLRYYRAKRDLGAWLLLLAAAAVYFSYAVSREEALQTLVVCGVTLAGVYSVHTTRSDLQFVFHYLPHPRWQLVCEYSLFVAPVSAGLLLAGWWPHTVLLQAGAALTAWVQPRTARATRVFAARWIPAVHFEWKAGLRQHRLVIGVLGVLVLAGSPVKLFGPAALLLLNAVVLNFYRHHEPLLLLDVRHEGAQRFLEGKVRFCVTTLAAMNCVPLLVNSCFHPESAWFCALIFGGFLVMGAGTVYLKYADYRPNGSRSLHADDLLLYAGLLLPYLLPLAVYSCYSTRKKALLNLSMYCDDPPTPAAV